MWNVSVIVIILYCISSLLSTFFLVWLTTLMIRYKLIHQAKEEKKLFISKPIHMLRCQHIFALSSSWVFTIQVQEFLFFADFFCWWHKKHADFNTCSGGWMQKLVRSIFARTDDCLTLLFISSSLRRLLWYICANLNILEYDFTFTRDIQSLLAHNVFISKISSVLFYSLCAYHEIIMKWVLFVCTVDVINFS